MFDFDTLYPAVLAKMFPDPTVRRQVQDILNRYGAEGYHHEPIRVRLAILKLAGPDLEAIRTNFGYALTDYRDVLAWAEYPNAIKSDSWRIPDGSPEKIRINNADQRQYQERLDNFVHEDGDHNG